ncbi:MAG: 50S ribosome-binding GTPase, partial [Planctomycetota bacterium]|nr:50S ribosome-binding GTPase [Planctomycetota bacterium]
MSVFAAVMTGKGTAAISTIQVFGGAAEAVIKKIFKPAGVKPSEFKTGKILLGTIIDSLRRETIDQVTIGCEGPEAIAIHCHGNPLIVEMIMQLLQRNGVTLLTAEELLAKILTAQKPASTIAFEAKLAQLKAQTLQGTKIIVNQIEGGLSKIAAQWLQNIDARTLEEMKSDAEQILRDSQIAKLIINGCTAVIAGPPNTGKSTLLNCLSGRQKAIVSEIKGTTRDWVSARCQIEPLSIELIDTAGLDEKLASTPKNTIAKAAQEKTVEILDRADLILLVLDNSQPENSLDGRLLKKIANKKILTVLNKSDLPARFDTDKLPEILSNTVSISAKFGNGIENLARKILQICGVADFNLQTPVWITCRQENLLKQLKKVKSRKQAVALV